MSKVERSDNALAATHIPGLTRREGLAAFLPVFAIYALLDIQKSSAGSARLRAYAWINRQHEIAKALSAGTLSPIAWMEEVERLAKEVDVDELMATVNKSKVAAAAGPFNNDPPKRFVKFLDEQGEPRKLAFGAALFDFAPHHVITPHGHRHMVSAHLVVAGKFRVRNFDRLRDEGNAMVIRPTRDYVASVGEVSTMSSARDNIHWFVPQGGPATTFDVIISGLDKGQDDYEIRAVDPLGGRKLRDGSIVAPIMEFENASAKYTAEV